DGVTLPAGAEVKVEVQGTITAVGELTSPRFAHAEGHEAYAREVREVVGLWRFMPAVAEAKCVPKDSEATLYVWFELKDGKPTVSVSAPPKRTAKPAGKLTFRKRPDIVYPLIARRKGIEGETIVLVRVLRSGEITGTGIRSRAVMGEFD